MSASLRPSSSPNPTRPILYKEGSDSLLIPGFLMSEAGVSLITFGAWVALNPALRTLLTWAGAILCLVGIVLIPCWVMYRMKATLHTTAAVVQADETVLVY